MMSRERMWRTPRLGRLAAAAAVALAVSGGAACGTSSTPVTPTPVVPVTEVKTGTLTPNGALVFPFAVTAAGAVTATLTTISPDSTILIGLELGTWNGSACQIILGNESATQGTVVTANATAAGNVCLRVADSGGTLVAPADFTVTIVHP